METPPTPGDIPQKHAQWALVALTLAAFLLRLHGLDAEEPWFDEVFSIVLAAQDLPELMRRAIADQTNPPGFYLLLWGWTRLVGDGLAAMRLLPALCATFTVPALAYAARAFGLSWRASLVAGALVAVSPLAWAMSSELRAYAPLLLATVLTLHALAAGRTPLAVLGAVAMVMLHYLGAFALLAIAAGFAWTDRRAALRTVGAGTIAAAALGTWMLVVVCAASAGGSAGVGGNAGWVALPGVGDVVHFASAVLGAFASDLGLTVAAAVLVAATAFVVQRRIVAARVAVALAIVPLVLVLAIGAVTGRGLWVPRYLIITLPGWYLLIAAALEPLTPSTRRLATIALLAWATIGGYASERARPKKTAWSRVAADLVSHGTTVICTNESYVALPFRYVAILGHADLTVLDLDQCTAERSPQAIVIREGTERSLAMLRERGLVVGTAEPLGTDLPVTYRYALGVPTKSAP